MTGVKHPDQSAGVTLLSLLLAGLLWFSVALERPGEVQIQVQVVPEHLPSGLQVVSAAPGSVEVTVSGPRILLIGLSLSRGSCGLDLTGAAAGPASFGTNDCSFGLNRELKVVRVHPAAISLTLVKAAPR